MIDEFSQKLLSSTTLADTPVPIRQTRIAFDRLREILQLFRQIAPLYIQDQPNDSLKAVWDRFEALEGEMALGLLTASNPEWYRTRAGSQDPTRLKVVGEPE